MRKPFLGKLFYVIFDQSFCMNYKLSLFVVSMTLFTCAAQAQVQKIMTLAGRGSAGFSGDGSNSSSCEFSGPVGVAVDTAGNVFVNDFYNRRIRKIAVNGIITTIAGNGGTGNTGNGSLGTSAEVNPYGVAVDRKGNVFMTDANFSQVRKVNYLGIMSNVAGGPTFGYSGDGGAATNARLTTPHGLCVDKAGNIFVAEAGNHVIRKIDTFGRISTVAGVGTTPGYFGDGGQANFALLDSPYAVAVDHIGNIFISDFKNNVIRKVDTFKTISTVVGTYNVRGYSGDGGLSTAALLNSPKGIAVDTAGNLFIADADNNVVRMVSAATGIISTIAGNGTAGFSGDLGWATSANLLNPYAVAIDHHGSVYIADANNQRVRKTYTPGVGVADVQSGTGLTVFPNPFSDVVTVTGLQAGDRIVIADIAGRVVSKTIVATTEQQELPLSYLSKGLYLLQITDKAGMKKMPIKIAKD